METAIANPWKVDTVDLQPPAENPALYKSWATPAGYVMSAWTSATALEHAADVISHH